MLKNLSFLRTFTKYTDHMDAKEWESLTSYTRKPTYKSFWQLSHVCTHKSAPFCLSLSRKWTPISQYFSLRPSTHSRKRSEVRLKKVFWGFMVCNILYLHVLRRHEQMNEMSELFWSTSLKSFSLTNELFIKEIEVFEGHPRIMNH